MFLIHWYWQILLTSSQSPFSSCARLRLRTVGLRGWTLERHHWSSWNEISNTRLPQLVKNISGPWDTLFKHFAIQQKYHPPMLNFFLKVYQALALCKITNRNKITFKTWIYLTKLHSVSVVLFLTTVNCQLVWVFRIYLNVPPSLGIT